MYKFKTKSATTTKLPLSVNDQIPHSDYWAKSYFIYACMYLVRFKDFFYKKNKVLSFKIGFLRKFLTLEDFKNIFSSVLTIFYSHRKKCQEVLKNGEKFSFLGGKIEKHVK